MAEKSDPQKPKRHIGKKLIILGTVGQVAFCSLPGNVQEDIKEAVLYGPISRVVQCVKEGVDEYGPFVVEPAFQPSYIAYKVPPHPAVPSLASSIATADFDSNLNFNV